tara:strand:- start:1246 stop:1917 length:672 start_codon:yes stop_codon:yes gene_type:complete
MYTFSNLFTSIASLLLTAIITINNLESPGVSTAMWWVSGSISLSISIINTIATFCKWDRKYLLLFQIYTKLEQEIWMYLELVGPYAFMHNHNDNTFKSATHKEKLKTFLAKIELLHKRLNENLLDIEENDQDDKDALRNRNHSKVSTPNKQIQQPSGLTSKTPSDITNTNNADEDVVLDIHDTDVHGLLKMTQLSHIKERKKDKQNDEEKDDDKNKDKNTTNP